jgi:iron complex outermembrane receptor protein
VLRDPSSLLETAPVVTTTGERVEQTARITAAVGERFTVGAGIDESVDRITVDQSTLAGLEANRVTTRPAATATWHATPNTDALALADVECDRTHGTGRVDSGFCTPEPGGRVGVSQRLGPAFELRGNVGHYVRPPTLGELYGVSAVVHGNSALAAETGETADAGVRFARESHDASVQADAYGFMRDAGDLVSYRQNVLGVIVPYNVGRARVVGAEVAASLDALRTVSDTLSLTVMDPRDTSPSRTLTNDILPFRSRLVVSDYAEAHSRNGLSALSVDRSAIGVRVTHRSSRYADAAGLIVLPAQTTFDVEASASFLRRAFTLRVALRDVFDARQVDTVGLPLPGRSAHASLEAYFR